MQPLGYSSTPPRPQNISYLRQVPMPPTTLYDPLFFNSMLQPDQVPFNPRSPQLSYHGQPINNIELPVATHYNSIMPASSISSRIPPVPIDGEQFNKKSPVMPMNMTVLDQQHYSNFNNAPHQRSFKPSTSNEPSNLPRFTGDNNQRQIEIMPNATDPDDHLRGSVMPRPSLLHRSQNEKRPEENGTVDVYGANYADSTHIQTEQREGGLQSARLAITNQKNRSSPTKEQGTMLGGRGRTRATKRQEVGESSTSMSSKRFRREVVVRKESSVTQEVIKLGSTQPQENNEAANSNVSSRPRNDSRKINNAVYDPSFEGMGLAVDPHLRFFSST
ncbi:hypothetical protein PanWU01x14_139910 [Parasponia andersonii]|uniref:Uncharacterized protein n=1 Tax=Parasponia andersonii TaxID=3476 RepID=A0A2P5CMN0_PARAD|nr:hypothetical protein PanWU01x14_139910 [Parasponia andersonii]